jgi:class 3 adenylate cyclase
MMGFSTSFLCLIITHIHSSLCSGPRTTLQGYGDLHDPKYEDMAITRDMYDINPYSSIKSRYTGLPINHDYCPIKITIYPSSVLEDIYVTHYPLMFSIACVLIFMFTSLVFIMYDFKVERRQRIVLKSAERSNAVVSKLFPSQVRDQILLDANNNTNSHQQSSSDVDEGVRERSNSISIRKQQRKTSITTGGEGGGEGEAFSVPKVSPRPIADLYPETTVLFADIKGFTQWSSSRTPTEVFTLLETLYGEYDKCATARKVFKVETIGDCYVAVVGLPEPRKNHAVVMVRFAIDMLQKADQLMQNMAISLGPDTVDLSIRIGLNSGPTTAGVLRGEKSRFQLFGDTVNTAARMESNGLPRRIHCTEATADLLVQAGKYHWVTKRDTMIEVKGKGLLQTYWVKSSSDVASVSSRSGATDVVVDTTFAGKNHLDTIIDKIDEYVS